jgi:hypothetical protein
LCCPADPRSRRRASHGKTVSSGGDLKIIGAASLVTWKEPFGLRIVPSGARKRGRATCHAGARVIVPEACPDLACGRHSKPSQELRRRA